MGEAFIDHLKLKIIETLNLIDVTADEMEADAPLVGGDLGIDSIDVLELVMMIEKDFGIKIDNKQLGEQVFSSLTALSDYIQENMPQRPGSQPSYQDRTN